MEDELYSAIKRNLENDGSLRQLRSDFEHEILSLLSNTRPKECITGAKTSERRVVEELIADYLEWMGYSATKTVFNSESRRLNSNVNPDRSGIAEELELDYNCEYSLLVSFFIVNISLVVNIVKFLLI